MNTIKSNVDLLVIGAGPTGIAALFYAKAAGLRAVGIDSGYGILSSINSYMDNLILTSPSNHYEVDGIPLDCRNSESPTKAEIIDYYARLINWGHLDILDGHKCIAVRPDRGKVAVTTDTAFGRRKLYAKRIVITSWFEPRPGILKDRFKWTGIRVLNEIRNPAIYAGRNVIVMGGGMSAYETCVRFMMNGQKIICINRGNASKFFFSPFFQGLLEVTSSQLFEHIRSIKQSRNMLLLTSNKGAKTEVRCDLVIHRIGVRVNLKMISILTASKIIDSEMAARLQTLETADDHYRRNPTLSHTELIKTTIDSWPNLSEYVVHGKSGVYFAGGILHIGGSSAGVRASIYTSKLVVSSIKADRKKLITGSLPFVIAKWVGKSGETVNINRLKKLIPVRINGDRYTLARILREDDFGQSLAEPEIAAPSLRILKRQLILSVDGRRSVGDILFIVSRTKQQERQYLKILVRLFRNNVLTWLPPRARQVSSSKPEVTRVLYP